MFHSFVDRLIDSLLTILLDFNFVIIENIAHNLQHDQLQT
jgi:hypothetical protein